ncbi:MAG: hypothetical protein ACQEQV_07445 [Fibrobacterota bacterium]
MIEHQELIRFIIGSAILLLMLIHRTHRKVVPWYHLFTASYLMLFCGWISTMVEGFVLPDFFNILEHLFYALSAFLLFLWIRKSTFPKKDGRSA